VKPALTFAGPILKQLVFRQNTSEENRQNNYKVHEKEKVRNL